MFTVKIDSIYEADFISGLFAQAFKNPGKTKDLAQAFENAKIRAIGKTAASLRKRIVEAFKENTFGWKHTEYSNWLGIGQRVETDDLHESNQPKKAFTSSGKRKKAGYSLKTMINPPKSGNPVGGKYPKLMRYLLNDDNFTVGLVPEISGKRWAALFQLFQSGGIITPTGKNGAPGTPARTRRYLASIGIYTKRNHAFKMPARPVIALIQQRHDPNALYKANFWEKLRSGK